jgi:hypothetical protein
MMIRLPFSYEVRGVARGNQSSSERSYWDAVEVDLPEPSEDEAPVALEWDERTNLPPGVTVVGDWWTPPPEGGLRHTRHFDGSHWTPVLESDADKTLRAVPLSVARFVDLAEGGNAKGLLFTEGFKGSLTAPAADEFSLIQRSTFGTRRARVDALAEEMIAVGGVLYMRCPEPRIVVVLASIDDDRMNRLRRFGCLLRLTADRDLIAYHKAELFTPREWKQAMTFARRENARLVGKELFNSGNDLRRPDIRRGYPAGDWRETLLRIETRLISFVSSFEALPLASRPTSVLRSYCDLRDALPVLGTEDGLLLAERSAAALLPHLRGERSATASRLERLLSELHNRPISADDIDISAPAVTPP